MKLTILLSLAAVLLTGCVAQMVTNSMDHDKYSQYVQETNRLNTEREKSNLAPVHVMTFDEWRGKATPPASSANK